MFGELSKKELVFAFAYKSIFVATDDQNLVMGNVPNKGRYLNIEDSDVKFITSLT